MFARIFQILFYVAYPAAVYFGYRYLPTRQLGLVLLALYGFAALLKIRGSAGDIRSIVAQHVPLVALIAAAAVLENDTLLLFLPMVVSAYLLFTFAWSLRKGPPMIERFARAIEGDLPPFTLAYCRRVTVLWCVFMTLNTLTIAVLIAAAPIELWALYTGGLFYLLLGLLIGGELLYRKWFFRFYGDGFLDRLFAKLFPAEATEAGRRSLAYDRARRLREAEAGAAGTTRA